MTWMLLFNKLIISLLTFTRFYQDSNIANKFLPTHQAVGVFFIVSFLFNKKKGNI